jgi:hypothetical protein
MRPLPAVAFGQENYERKRRVRGKLLKWGKGPVVSKTLPEHPVRVRKVRHEADEQG